MIRLVAMALLVSATTEPPSGTGRQGKAVQDAAESELANCLERSEGTNLAWGLCTGAERERQERRLNETWKRVYALAHGRTRSDLLAEQRAWIRYKDAACEMWANGEWGREGQVLSWAMCKAEVISARVKDLEEIGRDLAQR